MPPRISEERLERNRESLWELANTRPQDIVRDKMGGDRISGARRKHPIPSIGHRSGKLTVTGYVKGVRGGVKSLIVECGCGSGEYTVDQHNFKTFKSTRCNICAKKSAHTKRYWVYSEAMPDDAHRTRLLNRLSSAIGRCHVASNRAYPHYGGWGITVHKPWRDDRTKFLLYVQTLAGWDKPELEMDRTDVNKGYTPNNLRFVTRSVNMANRRSVTALQKEVADLRSRLRRAEESLHDRDR